MSVINNNIDIEDDSSDEDDLDYDFSDNNSVYSDDDSDSDNNSENNNDDDTDSDESNYSNNTENNDEKYLYDHDNENDWYEDNSYETLYLDATICGMREDNHKSINILKSFIFNQIMKNPSYLFSLMKSNIIKNDIEIVKYVLKKNPSLILYASNKIKNNYDIGLYCVTINPLLIKYLSKELRDNNIIIRNVIKKSPLLLEYASYRLKNDSDMLHLVMKDSQCKGLQFFFNRKYYGEKYILNNISVIYYCIKKYHIDIYILLKNYSFRFINKFMEETNILKILYILDNSYIYDRLSILKFMSFESIQDIVDFY
jgi:hypothetical protein